MNTKHVIITLNFFIAVLPLVGMDSKQLPHFTKEEDVFNVMAAQCPEAIRIIARDLLARNPGIVWQEFRDLYTARQNGQPPFVNATSAMIHAIWPQVRAIRRDALKKDMFNCKCVFRSIPNLEGLIASLKNGIKQKEQTPSAIRALIIVDPDLRMQFFNTEAGERSCIYCSFIAQLLRLAIPADFRDAEDILDNCPNSLTSEKLKWIWPIILIDITYDPIMRNRERFTKLEQLMNSNDFVIITTFDTEFINRLKNKNGLMIVNLESSRLNDRLITLAELARQHNCPPEIVKNLDAINEMVPQEEYLDDEAVPLAFDILNIIMAKAGHIFLTDGKFDKIKARNYFSNGFFRDVRSWRHPY